MKKMIHRNLAALRAQAAALGITPVQGGASAIYDFANNVTLAQTLAPAVRTTTGTGTGVDLQNCVYDGFAILDVGTTGPAGVDGTWTFAIQESKNNNTLDPSGAAEAYAAVERTIGTLTMTASSVSKQNFVRSKRYVRAVATVSGATTGALFGILIGSQKGTF